MQKHHAQVFGSKSFNFHTQSQKGNFHTAKKAIVKGKYRFKKQFNN